MKEDKTQKMLKLEIEKIRQDIQKDIRARQRAVVNRLVYRVPVQMLKYDCSPIQEEDEEMKDHK